MNKETKYYTRSNGEKVDINTMNTEHILNALNKKYKEVFETKNKKEFANKFNEINDLKEGLYSRFNDYNETLGDD